MEKTTFKNASEDAYVSGLLWREEEPSLPNNYEMAKKRLQTLKKKFESCPRSERDMQSQSRMTLRKAMWINWVKRKYSAIVKWLGTYHTDLSLTPRNLIVWEEYTMHEQNSWDKVWAIRSTQGQIFSPLCLESSGFVKEELQWLLMRKKCTICFASWPWQASDDILMEKLPERRTECVSLRENSVWRSVCTIQSKRRRNADENGEDLPLGVKSSPQALLHGWWPTINGFSRGSYWNAEADDWVVAPWRFPPT